MKRKDIVEGCQYKIKRLGTPWGDLCYGVGDIVRVKKLMNNKRNGRREICIVSENGCNQSCSSQNLEVIND